MIIDGEIRKRDGKLTGDWDVGAREGRGVERLPARSARREAAGDDGTVSSRHLVRRGGEIDLAVPAGSNADGLPTMAPSWMSRHPVPSTRRSRSASSSPAAAIPAHVHSFEDSLFVLEGELVVDTADGAFALRPGDYGVTGDRCAARAPQRLGRARAVGGDVGAAAATPDRRRHVPGTRPPDARSRSSWTCAIRARVRSATSTRRTWRSASRRRTCSRSRRACGRRCSSTAASR